MSLPKLNPVEPPWYGPVCPVVGEGWHREVSPYPNQKTWLLGPSFEGLDSEVDPILGQRTESDVLKIPTPCGPLRVQGLKDFVMVKGSGYFFLPGRIAIRFLSS